MNIIWENKVENLKKVEEILRNYEMDLLLLPEMSLTGFSMNTDITKEKNLETVQRIMELSKRYKTGIGIGWVKDCNGICENHYSIINGNEQILDYTKIHPFSYGGENQYFKGGGSISFCKINDFTVSAAICYDLRFSELFAKISEKADLIIIPANWPDKRCEHWKTLLKARAVENQCYIAGINCGGNVGGIFYSGNSMIYNPNGDEVLCEQFNLGSCDEEKVMIFDVKNDVSCFRTEFPVRKDRKEELYGKL